MQITIPLAFVVVAVAIGNTVPVVQAGIATRYWDCCKPSASWSGKAEVYAPVDVCEADGNTLIPASKADAGQSGCTGGNQFACSCMQPFVDTVDPTLAYGFVAYGSGQEKETNCACYEADFKKTDLDGKPMHVQKLIMQVINTGDDVEKQNFDLAIPGGGLGAFQQGCPKQWSSSVDSWGKLYGGVETVDQCSNLPKDLHSGCEFRFKQWGNNPELLSAPKRVTCPKGLIDRSGCQRKDDSTQTPFKGKTGPSGQPAPDNYKRDRSVCSSGSKQTVDSPAPAPYTASGADGYSTPTPTDGAAPKTDVNPPVKKCSKRRRR